MSDSYPDKRKMCHRTGFSRSCRDLLDEGVCQDRWKRVTGYDLNDKGPEPKVIDTYMCVDDAQFLLQQSFEYRLVAVQKAVEARGNAMVAMLGEAILRQEQQHNEALGMARDIRPLPIAVNGAKKAIEAEHEAVPMIGHEGE